MGQLDFISRLLSSLQHSSRSSPHPRAFPGTGMWGGGSTNGTLGGPGCGTPCPASLRTAATAGQFPAQGS